MTAGDLGAAVREATSIDPEVFDARVAADATFIKRELAAGTFDNPGPIVGLEYEFYAVDAEGALRRVSRPMLELIGFVPELGLHNAEMSTSPQPLNAHGLTGQQAEVRARLKAALEAVDSEGMRLVSDGLWTVPPGGESTLSYLTDTVTVDDVTVGVNVSDSPRYHALSNDPGQVRTGKRIDVPHVERTAETVALASLTTSIQPHFQVPRAVDLPTRFNYALRIAGPLLALGVNSPVLPAALYPDDVDPDVVLADGWAEHRASIFETVLNDPDRPRGKVGFPRDLDTAREAVDRIVEDDTLLPLAVDPGNRFDESFAYWTRKRATYWRWVRPVFEGADRRGANARIEFRPLPGQPTVRDTIAFQAAFAGLMVELPASDHPVRELDWGDAVDNFYGAMEDGLQADLRWIDADGIETHTTGSIYGDLLARAAEGLKATGLSEREAAEYLAPLRHRVRTGMTPARWKREVIRSALDDGADLEGAIARMQRRYIEHQRDSLLGGMFADWPTPTRRVVT